MRSTLFAAALLLPVVALATEHVPTIPDRFVGSWAGSPASCGSDADDLVLRLDHHHISYWESEGPVRSVVVRGGNEVALISELSGEGETWLSTAKFELSSDGAILTDSTTIPGQDIVRYRCPAGSAARPDN